MNYRVFLSAALIGSFGAPVPGLAQDVVEQALGGAVITCTGAVAWSEEGNDARPQVEPLRLAVRDAEDASQIALFLSPDNFVEEDVWNCQDGLCMSTAATSRSATTNVVQLHRGLDLPGGEVVYAMDAAFIIVSAGERPMQTQRAMGQGAFFCGRALPAGLVAAESQ